MKNRWEIRVIEACLVPVKACLFIVALGVMYWFDRGMPKDQHNVWERDKCPLDCPHWKGGTDGTSV